MKFPTPLAVLALLCACAEGTDVQFDGAAQYLHVNRAGLDRIVALVDACRPARRDTSLSRVFANRHRANRGLYCQRPGGDISEIVDELNRNHVVAVDYAVSGEDSANEALESVDILVFAAGFSVSGRSVSLVYYATPASDPAHIERHPDGPVMLERRAVTAAPYHWFWESSST